jgi:hypothetical protein
MTFPLDHAVIAVRDRMDEAERVFRRMGFTLTPRGRHRQGSLNHLMMFPDNYLELIGFPPGGEHLRPDLTESPIGLDGLVLRPEDAAATAADLVARGYAPSGPQELSRPLELDGRSYEARFSTVRFARGAVEGGRLYFCQHLTPELVWRPEWLTHANGAAGIVGFTIAVPDPANEAARYGEMLRAPVTNPVGDGSVVVGLEGGAIELVTPADLNRRLGALAPSPADHLGRPRTAYMAMVTLRVSSLAATEAVLRAGGFTVGRLSSDAVAVPAPEAMNCVISFTQ